MPYNQRISLEVSGFAFFRLLLRDVVMGSVSWVLPPRLVCMLQDDITTALFDSEFVGIP